MNRPIKFRAWWPSENKMVAYEDFLLYDHGTEPTSFVMSLRGEPYNYQYMQFTGLLDKNGTEIFEGDIVRNYRQNYEVSWNIGNAQFGLNALYANDEGNHIHSSRVPIRDWNWCATPIDENWREQDKPRMGYGINFHGDNRKIEACEVIGNIYENKELLDEKV